MSAPLHMVGNAHLDPAWMWRWGEGLEAFLATCRAAIDRMGETPEFIFTCSSAAHYRWVEQVDPRLFEEIRRRVAAGQWEIAGGWWVQADCNLPSGEGFVRQALLGQRYFLSHFGRRALVGYSPDAFGHTLGLPQLLRRAGMRGYVYCRPDPTELALPSPLVRWRGLDGSAIPAYRIPFHYNMYESSVPQKVADLEAALDRPSALTGGEETLRRFGEEWMLFYGVGNHGGGPTREHIAQIIELDRPDRPLLFSTPDRFFAHVGDNAMPEWSDDLQLNAPGCYAAHSEIKRLNRRAEYDLMSAERLATLASALLDVPYPADELRGAWERVCFNHFHDILCGVAIPEALDDAVQSYGAALEVATRVRTIAVQRLALALDTTGAGQALIVFNPTTLPQRTCTTFELWHDIDKSLWSQPVPLRVTDDQGMELPCQQGFTSGKIGRDRVAATIPVDLPPLGWRLYRVHYGEPSVATVPPDGTYASDTVLENAFTRVEFDTASGAILRWRDKVKGRELAAGSLALPAVYEDGTDTWGHGAVRFDRYRANFAARSVRLVEHGPTHATLRVVSVWEHCEIRQDFRLYHNDAALHIAATVRWNAQHTLLKLLFPVLLDHPLHLAESAYAVTQKLCDGVERPCGVWTAIVESGEQSAGLGVLSDAKHSCSAAGNTLALTLLRSPSYATHDPHPHNADEELLFIDQGVQRFNYSIVPLGGSRDEVSSVLHHRAQTLMSQPIAHIESAHPSGAGQLSGEYSGLSVTPATVLATVVKRGEDGGWIVRLYNPTSQQQECRIRSEMLGVQWSGAVGAWRILTLQARGVEGVREVDLVELEVQSELQRTN